MFVVYVISSSAPSNSFVSRPLHNIVTCFAKRLLLSKCKQDILPLGAFSQLFCSLVDYTCKVLLWCIKLSLKKCPFTGWTSSHKKQSLVFDFDTCKNLRRILSKLSSEFHIHLSIEASVTTTINRLFGKQGLPFLAWYYSFPTLPSLVGTGRESFYTSGRVYYVGSQVMVGI